MKYLFITALMAIVACTPKTQTSETFVVNGKAIGGYDPVSFFKEASAVEGFDSLAYTYNDAQWFFSSRENLEAFKDMPEQYAPQYGGYCAYGTAEGHKAPTEVDTWTIVNDKLYFNYNQEVKSLWSKDQPGMIEKANKQWPLIKDQ